MSATPDESHPSPSTAQPSPVASPCILYVEDDADLRGVYVELLSTLGYRVDVAKDGHEGWERFRLGGYDLLITDNEMPRLTGLELVKRVRSAGFALPIVMASGSCNAEDAQSGPLLPGTEVLKKPFTPGALLTTVRRILGAPPAQQRLEPGNKTREP